MNDTPREVLRQQARLMAQRPIEERLARVFEWSSDALATSREAFFSRERARRPDATRGQLAVEWVAFQYGIQVGPGFAERYEALHSQGLT